MSGLTITMKGMLTCHCGEKTEVGVVAAPVHVAANACTTVRDLLQVTHDVPKGWRWSRHLCTFVCPACRGPE